MSALRFLSVRPAWALFLASSLLLAACAGGRGHPVRLSLPRLTAADGLPSSVAGLPEPDAPSDAEAAAVLFHELGGILQPLLALRQHGSTAQRRPRIVFLPAVASAVKKRYARGGFGGAVRNVVAVGMTGRVPLAPHAMADLMTDPAVERESLAAHLFEPAGVEYELPAASRRLYRVELRGVGTGPFTYDFRFDLAAERRATGDGRVLLRYDPRPRRSTLHVTLYRGGCLLEPDGAGCRATEIIVLGTDLQVPFFLEGAARSLARKRLVDRATNLWVRAWRAADASGRRVR